MSSEQLQQIQRIVHRLFYYNEEECKLFRDYLEELHDHKLDEKLPEDSFMEKWIKEQMFISSARGQLLTETSEFEEWKTVRAIMGNDAEWELCQQYLQEESWLLIRCHDEFRAFLSNPNSSNQANRVDYLRMYSKNGRIFLRRFKVRKLLQQIVDNATELKRLNMFLEKDSYYKNYPTQIQVYTDVIAFLTSTVPRGIFPDIWGIEYLGGSLLQEFELWKLMQDLLEGPQQQNLFNRFLADTGRPHCTIKPLREIDSDYNKLIDQINLLRDFQGWSSQRMKSLKHLCLEKIVQRPIYPSQVQDEYEKFMENRYYNRTILFISRVFHFFSNHLIRFIMLMAGIMILFSFGYVTQV
jgi:hypothetical protein